jgi:hypothetical protein
MDSTEIHHKSQSLNNHGTCIHRQTNKQKKQEI